MIKLPKALLFDLDGTLADTVAQLAKAACKSARALNLEEPSIESTKSYVGNGVNMLLARVIAKKFDVNLEELDKDLLKKAREVFNVEYMQGLDKDYRVYPGVKEGLACFKDLGIKLAVVTNKPQVFAVPLLKHMGLFEYCDFILGGEVIEKRKPDPMPILYTLEKLGVDKDSAWMIGDSDNDIIAANNVGMRSVFFTFGYCFVKEEHMHYDYRFDSFNELTDLIKRLKG